MNHQISCPDCGSGSLTLSGIGDEYSNVNPLICLDCGFVFDVAEGSPTPNESGNLYRLAYMLNKYGKNKALHFFREATRMDKKAAKQIIEGLRFDDIRAKRRN